MKNDGQQQEDRSGRLDRCSIIMLVVFVVGFVVIIGMIAEQLIAKP